MGNPIFEFSGISRKSDENNDSLLLLVAKNIRYNFSISSPMMCTSNPSSYILIYFVFILQILKYMSNEEGPNSAANEIVASNSGSGDLITRIVISETEVHHSGIYKCEPGAAPIASVQVHVLDGEYEYI